MNLNAKERKGLNAKVRKGSLIALERSDMKYFMNRRYLTPLRSRSAWSAAAISNVHGRIQWNRF